MLRWLFQSDALDPFHSTGVAPLLQGGSVLRMFHKELEAYLVAEGLFDEEITEDGEEVDSTNAHCTQSPHFSSALAGTALKS